MKVAFKIYIPLVILQCFLLACSSSGDDSPDETIYPPAGAELLSPANNELCLTGNDIGEDLSTVTFTWEAAEYTTGYNLIVKNLTDQQEATYNSTVTNKEVTLTRGNAYSWYIISKSDKTTETSKSNIWKFYLAGEGNSSYAPFPASAVYPKQGTGITLQETTITLKWEATDVENDIENYDVFWGETTTLENAISTKITDNFYTIDNVSSGKTYYWKILTRDSQNNTSYSEIFSFKTK